MHHFRLFFVSVLSILTLACSIGACVCASKTKYKNCLCGFVYPNGDKKLRSIVLYMLYFGAMPFHNFFQPVFQIDSLENTKCIDKDILGYINFNEKLYHYYMVYKAWETIHLIDITIFGFIL